MNGLDKITDRILFDAKTECDAILDDAHKNASEIKQGYEQRAKTEAKKILDQAQIQAEMKKKNDLNYAQLQIRMQLLSVKNKLIEEAFARASVLLSFEKEENIGLLTTVAAKAAAGNEEVLLSKKLQKSHGNQIVSSINEKLKKLSKPDQITLSEETREVNGLVLKSGKIETSCTLDAILSAKRNQLIPLIHETLFQ